MHKGKPMYLRTTCVPAWTILGAANGFLFAVATDFSAYWYAPIGGALGGITADVLRCGIAPPVVVSSPTERAVLRSRPNKRPTKRALSKDEQNSLFKELRKTKKGKRTKGKKSTKRKPRK
tara:strand:+ start:248 stop:607 length:360 start_codon:yes stop_codon:yes gene_type:complete